MRQTLQFHCPYSWALGALKSKQHITIFCIFKVGKVQTPRPLKQYIYLLTLILSGSAAVYTDSLEFTNPRSLPQIPTYRLLDRQGKIKDGKVSILDYSYSMKLLRSHPKSTSANFCPFYYSSYIRICPSFQTPLPRTSPFF